MSNGIPNLPPGTDISGYNLNSITALPLALQIATLIGQNSLSVTPVAQTHFPPQVPVQQIQPGPSNGQTLPGLFGMQQPSAGGGLSMSQFLSDVVKLSTPVGSYPDDEDILVDALCESEVKGKTYKQALDGLHGVNNHAVNLWKDYYLDHTPRINQLVSQRRTFAKPGVVAKKPSISSISKARPPTSEIYRSAPSVSKGTAGDHASSSSTRRLSASSRVERENRGIPSYHPNSTTRQNDVKGKGKAVSTIRSRSPTPPKPSEEKGGRCRYTEEDRDFLVKYVRYRLKRDPNLSRNELCDKLAKKAPHHSSRSWLQHWSILRADYDLLIPEFARRDEVPTDNHADDDEESGSDYFSPSGDEGSQYSSDSEVDRQNMSGPGESLNEADKRVIARYIISIGQEWEMLNAREKWEPFEKMYPQRTYRAWQELIRSKTLEVDAVTSRYRRRQLSIQSQKGRPSWAAKKSAPVLDTPSNKRNRYIEGDVDFPENKRPKGT